MGWVDATRLTIYANNSKRSGRNLLYRALLELLARLDIAGATAVQGMAGFGEDRVIHTTKIELLALDLPVIVTVVDRTDRIAAVLPEVQAMVGEDAIALEAVRMTHR
jgi:PII-like signaling protein